MNYVQLGRTNLRTSVIGLGAGGPSRLGQKTGNSEAESVRIVREALDLGINLIDTAEAYGTQPIVGRAIRDVPRDEVILSTKKGVYRDDVPVSAADFTAGVEQSLRELGVDTIDIFHLHGVKAHQYPHARQEILPALLKLQEQGKLRWLGVTESFTQETRHEMVQLALADDEALRCWDVMMIGFNLLNQSARRLIFPRMQAQQIGGLGMFVVRRAFSQPERLREILQELAERGEIDPALAEDDDALDFLVHDGGATSLADAAYRYARDEPGLHVVLSGTGNVEHLRANVQSLLRPPLPEADRERVNAMFARVDSVSGS